MDIDDGKATPILRLSNEVEELLTEGLLAAAEDPWALSGEALSEVQRLRCAEA